jgi:hypothetical protein
LMASSKKVCARLPTPGVAWIHEIHTAGGVAASPP